MRSFTLPPGHGKKRPPPPTARLRPGETPEQNFRRRQLELPGLEEPPAPFADWRKKRARYRTRKPPRLLLLPP